MELWYSNREHTERFQREAQARQAAEASRVEAQAGVEEAKVRWRRP